LLDRHRTQDMQMKKLTSSRRAVSLAALLVATACGDGDRDHPFGDPDELRAYRVALEPVIVEVNAIETEVRERAVGSAGEATAANLDAVYRQVRPRLLEALVAHDHVEPPARLVGLHGEIRQLILLRLDAYALVMTGYAEGDEALYREAEANLAAANELVLTIDSQLCDIDIALGDRDQCPLLGSLSPVGLIVLSRRLVRGAPT
jgi:hypothetical protein